jgi:hypothetical protein
MDNISLGEEGDLHIKSFPLEITPSSSMEIEESLY